jgi:hypothetical protein
MLGVPGKPRSVWREPSRARGIGRQFYGSAASGSRELPMMMQVYQGCESIRFGTGALQEYYAG